MSDTPVTAEPNTPASAAPTGPLAGGDWPARVADGVEHAVGLVHDRVIRNVVVAARAVVFGVIIAAMALAVALLFGIVFIRLLDSYVFHRHVWIAYAIIGGLLVAGGAFCWTKAVQADRGGRA